jgi:hypothetical protein
MTERSIFPERIVEAGGRNLTIRALSFHELMVDVPELVGRVMDKMAGVQGEMTLEAMTAACSRELLELLSRTAGVEPDFWKQATAEEGAEALAAFAEVNLSQNFFDQVARLVHAGQGIGSQWSRLFSNTATAGATSETIPLAKLKALSAPSGRVTKRRL